MLLWLHTVCKFAASKYALPAVGETNEKALQAILEVLLLDLSFCLSTSQVKMKEQLGYSEN